MFRIQILHNSGDVYNVFLNFLIVKKFRIQILHSSGDVYNVFPNFLIVQQSIVQFNPELQDIERIYKTLFSLLIILILEFCRYLVFYLNNYIKAF